MKILDEVRYDIFRRVLAASVMGSNSSASEHIRHAEDVTAGAVKLMEGLGIVGDPQGPTDRDDWKYWQRAAYNTAEELKCSQQMSQNLLDANKEW